MEQTEAGRVGRLEPLLRVSGLRTHFPTARGVVRAVDGVSFDLARGETLAIVGESGSGKSVTAMSLLDMVRRPGRVVKGSVEFAGRDVLGLEDEQQRRIRGGGISMIFQDPMSSLDPIMRIRDQLVEAMLSHGKFSKQEAAARALDLLTRVGIPDPEARLADFPHTYSGGMRQRVMIAMALANDPDVIVADEPTTALDVTIQAQILDLLLDLNRDLGTGIILITHNLGVVARVCARVAVMYAGRIVESGPTDEVFADPRHPYTRALLAATPRLVGDASAHLESIPGRPPGLVDAIPGCVFAPRCALADDRCRREVPPVGTGAGRSAACWRSVRDGVLTALPPAPAPPTPTLTPPAPATGAVAWAGDAQPPLLAVADLSRTFAVRGGLHRLRRVTHQVNAVDGVTLDIRPGETVGVVGESGCGKSTLGKLILGIHQPTGGSVTFDGRDLTGAGAADRAWFRRNVQLVFQDPMSSLNPRMTIGQALREPLEVHGLARGAAASRRAAELLELVGLEPTVATRYPHEFSGGQRQRVVIARALAVEPRLLVCDEAVSALDVSLQAQIVGLLRRLQQELGLAYLFISHDLATVRHLSHRIAVMYLGKVVELGPAADVVAAPLHPYTAALLSAVPEPDPVVERTRTRIVLSGDVPSPLAPPSGCRFHTRCPIGPATRAERTVCATTAPVLTGGAHGVACHFAGELTARLRPEGVE
ncbi:MAG: ABC transporter ATP-binding protein [Motilibacteraceae bacterium]